MRKFNLSLVTLAALTTFNVANANSLEEAFANGKVSGELKSQFFQKENNASKTASIWTNGLNLSYNTGDYNGLSAGVTLQAAAVGAENFDAGYTNAFDSDQNVGGAVLSQAYIQYKRGNTSAKIGRQYISTPLIAGSGSRIFKQSFQAATLTNTDIEDTTISVIYANRFQGRTDGAEGAPTFEKLGDGVYSVYATNKSIENLTLEAQYVKGKNLLANNTKDLTLYYTNAVYDFNSFKLAGQYYNSDDNGIANNDGSAFGLNATTNIDDLSLGLSYSAVSKNGGIEASKLGAGADYIYTWSWIYGGVYSADTKAVKFDAGYKFVENLSGNFIYANWETANGGKNSETDFILDYNFSKNFSTTLVHAVYNDNLGWDKYQSRVYVSYKF